MTFFIFKSIYCEIEKKITKVFLYQSYSLFHITAFPYPDMIDPKTIYLTGEAAKFHKPGKSFFFILLLFHFCHFWIDVFRFL